MLDDVTPPPVRLDGYDPAQREAYDRFREIKALNAVAIPAGRISKETLTDIAQENVGLAFNRITQIASTGADKIALQAANSIIDRAHGKVGNDDAKTGTNITVVIQAYDTSGNKVVTIDQDTGDA